MKYLSFNPANSKTIWCLLATFKTCLTISSGIIKASKKLNTVIVVTGPIDLIISKKNIVIVENGSPLMGKVCGTGCILSAIIAAFLGSIDEGNLKREETEIACITALCTYGICGELASNSIKKTDGVILFKNKLIDYLSTIKAEDITKYAKYKSI